jgi:predicted HD phosphohydrolase
LREMGMFDEDIIKHLRAAALLHDIGHLTKRRSATRYTAL